VTNDVLTRGQHKSFTATVKFTIAFGAKHKPSVKTVGKSKVVIGN
jgi:hypothetical protein